MTANNSHAQVTRANSHEPGTVSDYLEFDEAAAAGTADAGTVRLYAKTDGLLYSKDDAGTETLVSGGSGGSASLVGCKVYNNAVQSIAENSNVALTFNSEDYDTDTLHDTGSNTSRITVNQTGVWRFSYGTHWATASATGIRVIFLRIDGTTNVEGSDHRVVGSTAVNVCTAKTVDVELTSGQYVEAMVFQNRGGGTALDAGFAHGTNPALVSFMSAQFLGAP